MTTTASKSGLRAAATAKRTKAAQRTPLPPRDLAVKLAQDTEPIDAKPTKASAKAAKTAPAEDPKDKAAHYAAQMEAAGWTPMVVRNDGLAELFGTRGVETLYIAFLNNVHVGGTTTYTYADRTIKLKNAAEVMRYAKERTPEEAKSRHEHVSGNKDFRKAPTGPTVASLPFDVAEVSDEELLATLAGRTVRWHNQYRVEAETGVIGPVKWLTVERRGGVRIVSFLDPHFGFRAFRLDNLEHVSGATRKTAAAPKPAKAAKSAPRRKAA